MFVEFAIVWGAKAQKSDRFFHKRAKKNDYRLLKRNRGMEVLTFFLAS